MDGYPLDEWNDNGYFTSILEKFHDEKKHVCINWNFGLVWPEELASEDEEAEKPPQAPKPVDPELETCQRQLRAGNHMLGSWIGQWDLGKGGWDSVALWVQVDENNLVVD